MTIWNRMQVRVAGALCGLMVGQPLLAVGGSASPSSPGLQGTARVVHALNRFTFGPKPGDLAAVEAIGLDRWFEQQLNPTHIDDSDLDQRLAAYPAMRLGQVELMQRYPNPQIIRSIAKGDLSLPNDPVQRAIYADQVAFYKMKQASDAAKGKAAAVAPAADNNGMNTMAAGASPASGDDALVRKGEAALNDAQAADPLGPPPDEHNELLYSEAETQRLLALAPDQRFSAILAMKPQALLGFRRSLSKKELSDLVAGMTPEQKETLQALPGSIRVIGAEALQARLMRDLYSNRQLEAVMTDFWLNHFNVYVKKSQLEPYLIPSFERDVIRPRALGRFEDLLVATAKSPAMLVYLDNWRSTGPDSQASQRAAMRPARLLNPDQAKAPEGLNENYARELMELHTLGVGGGYTQADVTQVAKVFTGWTIDKPYRGGLYTFEDRRHEPGSKTVLGKTIREGGEIEGMQVLHMLATSPATARFISTKLAVRFVSDEPPPALVDRMTQAFLNSQGDIKVVLRTMFRSPEFWSPAAERAKVKTPEEFVISAVRASGAKVTNPLPLVQALDRLGMPLYGMQTPNGYSWKQDGWVSTGALVSRMNFALVLSSDRLPGVHTEWPALLGEGSLHVTPISSGGETAEAAKERQLETILLGGPVSARTRATVLSQFNDEAMKSTAAKDFALKADDPVTATGKGAGRATFQAGPDARKAPGDLQAAGMAGLLLGSPEFQRR